MRPPDRPRPFWYLRRRPETVATDVDEELATHLDMRVRELKARGLDETTARREALRQFGDLAYTRAYCMKQDLRKEIGMGRALSLDEWVQDARMCVRSLWRAPVLALTIVVTVGLGLGATAVIFSAVDAALLRPLPYQQPERLVRIYTDAPPNRFRFSAVDYLALDAQQTQFQMIAAYTGRAMSFSDGVVAERIRGREVTWTYLRVLGISPALGRDFTRADATEGAPLAVILGHGFWQRQLGGRMDVLGRPLRLDGREYTVVGVLPAATGPLERDQEFFIVTQWQAPRRRGPFLYTTIARLQDTASWSAASEELRAINRRIFPIWRSSYQDEKATWSLIPLKEHVVGDAGTMAGLALGAVALVWLLACANASNLLIARVTSRRRELAIRTALGASRGRVVKYLLVESGVLATGAAFLGAALTWGGIRLLHAIEPADFPRTQEIAFDGTLLGILAALTASSVLLIGLIPALSGTAGALDESLRAEGRSATGNVRVRRFRRLLVATQFAIATPLIIIAVLLVVSLTELGRVDLGFDTTNLISASLSLPPAQYSEDGRARGFWEELQRRVGAVPGVEGVTFADGRPPADVGNFNNFELEASPTLPGQSPPVCPWVSVTPEYFRTLGLKLYEGRTLEERDALRENLEAVVVDRAWARRYFPRESAVGKRFKEGGCTDCPWTTVVGVVSDVTYAGLDHPEEGAVYWPMSPDRLSRVIIVRTKTEPAAVMSAVRQTVRDLDPTLPFASVATMDELVSRSLQRPRSMALLIGAFAVVALVLSTIGIYGVMAFYVQQHAKDIGIRLALGGHPRTVMRMVVGHGMLVVGGGVLAGVLAAAAIAPLVSTLLFRVQPLDVMAFVAVGGLLATIALAACAVPARNAVAAGPSVVLRNE